MSKIDLYDDEYQAPYRKKAKKKNKKSNHKHTYEDCLVFWIGSVHKGTRCSICGKIGDFSFMESVPCGNGFRRMLREDEILEKYKDLDIYDYDTKEKINDYKKK